MAAKRGATSELNHDNWDDDDKSEDAGQFAQASSDVLKDRVIKKAKRRGLGNTGGESASIFAGFGGFKAAPKETEAAANPFDFLGKSSKPEGVEGPPASKKSFKFDMPVKPLEGNIAPVFQFGTGSAPREPAKPSSGFALGDKKPTTGFSFGSSNPNSIFGAKDSSTSETSGFKFGSVSTSEPSKVGFTFGVTTAKPANEDAPKSSFSFGSPLSNKPILSETAKPESDKTANALVTSAESNLGQTTEKQPSLMDMFKPKPGSWKCSVCDVTNNADKDNCVACTTPKPGGAAPAGTEKPPAKKWECPTCMVSNDPEKLKCVCCETSKPGSSAPTTEAPKKLNDSSITSSGFKFGVVESSSTIPASTTGFSFGSLKSTTTTSNNGFKFGVTSTNPPAKTNDTSVTYSTEFLADLKELNLSVTEWVKTHVEKNGYIYLSPIFQDYEKHLSELKEQYKVKDSESEAPAKISGFGSNGVEGKMKEAVPELKTGFTFGTTATTEPRSGFSFGSGTLNSDKPKGFSIGATSSLDKKPEFSFGSSASDGNTPFSFGKPSGFSFGAIGQNPPLGDKGSSNQESAEGDDEDTPPKVEVSTVVEEDSLFSIRCKIFYKKGSEFVEKGLGMLHLKPVDADAGKKTQMLIRAETNLGNILLNVMLNSQMSFLRRNNNLQFVCIPNPTIPGVDGPTTMLIKVKNADAATDLETHINNRLSD